MARAQAPHDDAERHLGGRDREPVHERANGGERINAGLA